MDLSPTLLRYLELVPKAELHVHLEGSILPTTLLELARRHKVAALPQTLEELQEWIAYRDFDHFITSYSTISSCLKTGEDYELIAYEFGREMHRQHVRYAEVTVSVCMHRFTHGIPYDVLFSGLQRGREQARQEFGVEIRWVFDLVRSVTDSMLRQKRNEFTTEVAIESLGEGVVALGLGGLEAGFPPEQYTAYFDRALSAGLHSTPHAGEGAGPESVWGALHNLHAERIGHGVRSVEDSALVQHLAEQQIPLEVCPGSNVCLGIYSDFTAHPLRRLHAAGVPMSINADDPPFFNTSLNLEVQRLASAFAFDLATIDEFILNGVRHSFLPAERKESMEQEFRAEMVRLKQDLEIS